MNLKNVALYAKGAYSRSEDLDLDLDICCRADGNFVLTAHDRTKLLLEYMLYLYSFTDSGDFWLQYMIDISPQGVWALGYKTKGYNLWFAEEDSSVDYNFDIAVIHATLHHLSKMTWDMLGLGPDYEGNPDVLPLNEVNF